MIFSDSKKNLGTALAAAQAEMPMVGKDKVNPFYRSKYADLASVIKVVAPVLAKHGLSVIQTIDYLDRPETRVITTKDNKGNITTTERTEYPTVLSTVLLHSSGEFISSQMFLPLETLDSQKQGSAVTYARRYAYSAIVGIAADDDDDGNAASGRVEKPSTQTNESSVSHRPSEPVVQRSPVAASHQSSEPQLGSTPPEVIEARKKLVAKLEPYKSRIDKMNFVNSVIAPKQVKNSNELSLEEIKAVLNA